MPLGVQQPAADPVRLAAAGAANGHDLGWHHAEPGDRLGVLDVFDFLLVQVRRIVPGHQRDRVPGLGACARVGEAALDDVGLCVQRHRVTGRVLRHRQSTRGPVDHRSEAARQVLNDFEGFRTALQVQVTGEARLEPAEAVVYQLVAILADRVKRPLVDLRGRYVGAQPVALICDQVVKAPGRVIGPLGLEGAIPDPGVHAGRRVIVDRHLDLDQLDIVAARRHALEGCRVEPARDDRRVRIAELRLNDLGVCIPEGLILQLEVRAVRRDPAHADVPRRGSGKRDLVGPLVFAGRLAVDRVGHLGDVAAAARLDIDRNLDFSPDLGSVILGEIERRNAQDHPHRVDIGV